MKKRFTDEQIVKLIKEHEAGKSATDISREYNISQATFYSWQKKYSGRREKSRMGRTGKRNIPTMKTEILLKI